MRRVVGAFATVSLLMLASAQAQDVTLEVSSATIAAGATGQITVTLNAGTNEVAGTENELNWNTGELVVDNCVVNEAIDKDLQANLGDGTFKGIIINFTDLSPIDDGSVLYTCDVTVGATTAPGDYTVTCTNPASSDPEGGPGDGFDTACNDATITVPAEPQVMLTLNDIEVVPGGTATLEIALELLTDVEVAGTENVLRWDPAELSVSNCVVNAAHGKDLQQTTSPGEFKGLVISFTDLSPIEDGIVLYSCDVGLGAGTAAATTAGQAGPFEITCAEPGSSDPLGNELITICNNSTVTVIDPTPTPAPTATPTVIGLARAELLEAIDAEATELTLANVIGTLPSTGILEFEDGERILYTSLTNNGDGTFTLGGLERGYDDTTAAPHAAGEIVNIFEAPTPTPTNTVGSTSTPTSQPPATNTPSNPFIDDDGCAVAPVQSSTGWTLLLPLAALLWLRRRQK